MDEAIGNPSIDQMIKLARDQKQKEILTKFKSTLSDDDTTFVTEYEDHYEVTVVHASSEDGYTGGAEGYSIDKTTGKSKMMWHEHPMELRELVIEPDDKGDTK